MPMSLVLAIGIGMICAQSSAFQGLMRESYEFGCWVGSALLAAILRARQAPQSGQAQTEPRHDES